MKLRHFSGSIDVINFLIEKGAKPFAQNLQEKAPRQVALDNGIQAILLNRKHHNGNLYHDQEKKMQLQF